MLPAHTIVLPGNQAIYFSIPKNACTSLKLFCCDLLGKSVDETWQVHLQDYEHYTDSAEDQIAYKAFTKFAFVRNPWDRLVSCYRSKIDNPPDRRDHWLRNGIPEGFERFGFYARMPFDEFARSVCSLTDDESDPHFASQSSFIYRFDGEAKTPLCDFVGRVENLQADFDWLSGRLGFHHVDLAKENVSTQSGSYRKYYDRSLEQAVGERYQSDISLFGYSFDRTRV